ncbi:PKS-NRPS hybrid synthetase cheA [Linum grandiflorum]
MEAASDAAKEIALELGFPCIRGSYKKNASEVNRRLYMICSHGYRSLAYSSSRSGDSIRTTKTGKLGCRFKVCVRSISFGPGVYKWTIIRVEDTGFHNHKVEKFTEGSRQRNVLTQQMKDHIRQLEAGRVKPAEMQAIINDVYKKKCNRTQMYNQTAKIREERLCGASPTKWFLGEAKRKNYFTDWEVDEDHHVTNIFIAHPESVRMLRAWYFVVLIDSTYKTNVYKKAVFQLIGVTLVKRNFCIGMALVKDETAEKYVWVLKQLKTLLGERVPNAFVTDKERGLGVALTEVFPDSAHLLCVWHMKRNVVGKVTFLRDKDAGEAFIKGPWKKVLNAYNEKWFWAQWYELVNAGYGDELVQYLTAEWLPCRQKWARCYTNSVFHLGNTSTNRVESSHSSFKSWLNSSSHKRTHCFFVMTHLCLLK